MRLRAGRVAGGLDPGPPTPAGESSWTAGVGPRASPELPAPRGTRRILVAGVGYRNLRDLSVGPAMVERLRARGWPSGVEIEDLSFGAVHAVHWFQQTEPFEAVIFLTAVVRGRVAGAVYRCDWTMPLAGDDEVQTRVAEAVTGVIGLDTLLTVLGHFHALPPRVLVLEVEPRDEDWGEAFSPLVERAMIEVERLVQSEVDALLAA
ncbi:MAG: hydrogenase maturation protease [Chloroflexota bacterium]